jgi:Coenzyme PQQ synthesis protein D (PqqD)
MLDSATVVKKSANQVSCVLNEEAAVLDLDRALYFGLSGVAAHIWDVLQEPRSVAEICDDVMAQFDVASEVCRADVCSFVISLRDAGLVEIVG